MRGPRTAAIFPAEGHPTQYEFSEAELAALVEEARARGTYVMAHVYTDEGVRRCLKGGVRSIEHGNFMTEETVARLAEHGAFLDPTFISLVQRVETAAGMGLSSVIVDNLEQTIEKGKQVYSWAKRYQVPIALGTDLWGPEAQKSQLREFRIRREFDSPTEILRSATVVNAELLMQKGNLGTVAAGAYADLLVVDGNPLEDTEILVDSEWRLKLVMKGGVIYKNLLCEHNSAG
jgi:imidazolonepropionase-like amidohydrolase